jgi:hypothetical protein
MPASGEDESHGCIGVNGPGYSKRCLIRAHSQDHAKK